MVHYIIPTSIIKLDMDLVSFICTDTKILIDYMTSLYFLLQKIDFDYQLSGVNLLIILKIKKNIE